MARQLDRKLEVRIPLFPSATGCRVDSDLCASALECETCAHKLHDSGPTYDLGMRVPIDSASVALQLIAA